MSETGKYLVDREEWWPVLTVEPKSRYARDDAGLVDVPVALVEKYWAAQADMHEAAQMIAEYLGLDSEFRTPEERGKLIGLRDV